MNSAAKRTTRCREWERQRRNKFNEAISNLGKIVISIIKANEPEEKDSENIQYPKVEIIQKAILCLTNCVQEKSHLKAEILALQVKLDSLQSIKKKDASTQVSKISNKKCKNVKSINLLAKEKPIEANRISVLTENTKTESIQIKNNCTDSKSLQKLPTLLPRCMEKGPENTFVVLPAAPYIFPQRPLLFPTTPPAFVLVDTNIQKINKPNPQLKTSGDSTKTTMVNILPISAFSHSLSASKSKKANVKSKDLVAKKKFKKSDVKVNNKNADDSSNTNKDPKNISNNTSCEEKDSNKDKKDTNTETEIKSTVEKLEVKTLNNNNIESTMNSNESSSTNKNTMENNILIDNSKDTEEMKDKLINVDNKSLTPLISRVVEKSENTKIPKKDKVISQDKEDILIDKEKENKLPNILDASLCESAVDGGNVRLELAEEFLAASPTAAFLMSFPLVSGNRADSPYESQNTVPAATNKETNRRTEINLSSVPFYEKITNHDIKSKNYNKPEPTSSTDNKHNQIQKCVANTPITKSELKAPTNMSATTASENPFLSLPSLVSTTCSDATFGLDFDCNVNKCSTSQSTAYSNNNFFYKSDAFNAVKNTIYSTSTIASGHEYNSLSLYPCAMEKYGSKSKAEYSNVDDNFMKIGSSRLTYDIDLGWSHKGFDFVTCATTSTAHSVNKENLFSTAPTTYSTSYNPFNPDFHVPLVSNSSKKEISSKQNAFSDSITNFYSQTTTNLWHEDAPYYTNNISKVVTTKNQNFVPVDNSHANNNLKTSNHKQYESKRITDPGLDNSVKHANSGHQICDKYTKKSPSKMPINWMTSEIRSMQNNYSSSRVETKDNCGMKKQDESNYFPININNFSSQTPAEDFQVWPSMKPLGTTEISIEPPPINLPTLVGDLALGPHDKKKHTDVLNKGLSHADLQNCNNFLSVTQLMNRSDHVMPSRYTANIETTKSGPTKQNSSHYLNEPSRKSVSVSSRFECNMPQPCYISSDAKVQNSYENVNQFSQSKNKPKIDKNVKTHRNNYSAESLIRGGPCPKVQDFNGHHKYMMSSPKFNDFNNQQDSSVAQVSHYPPMLDYSDNSYTGQQFSGTTLYNTNTSTISNSFYTNFMPGSSNLISGNYSSGAFPTDYNIEYNQATECNYTPQKFEDLRRNNTISAPTNFKHSKRENASKHKLECSKKDGKKYPSKRPKINTEVEEWTDTSHIFWQNKLPGKRSTIADDLAIPNYVGNQIPPQYQPEFFNAHLMSNNTHSVGSGNDRPLVNIPVTSRANFNLSTIFPEITMKVQ